MHRNLFVTLPAIFGVLVDAVTSSFQGRQPDLAWLY